MPLRQRHPDLVGQVARSKRRDAFCGLASSRVGQARSSGVGREAHPKEKGIGRARGGGAAATGAISLAGRCPSWGSGASRTAAAARSAAGAVVGGEDGPDAGPRRLIALRDGSAIKERSGAGIRAFDFGHAQRSRFAPVRSG